MVDLRSHVETSVRLSMEEAETLLAEMADLRTARDEAIDSCVRLAQANTELGERVVMVDAALADANKEIERLRALKDSPAPSLTGTVPPEPQGAAPAEASEEETLSEAWIRRVEVSHGEALTAGGGPDAAPASWPWWGRVGPPDVGTWHLWASAEKGEAECGEATDAEVVFARRFDVLPHAQVCEDCRGFVAASDAQPPAQTNGDAAPHCKGVGRSPRAICFRPARANGYCGRHQKQAGEAVAHG